MALPGKPRLERIEEYLRDHQYADLHTLARETGVSLSTVRRALNELETNGRIRRHHGGASLVEENTAGGYDFITQDNRQAAEKHAIAAAVAAKVQPGMTVMLDGGTTTYAVARQLVGKRIIVITNSLPIAALYNEVSTCETIVTGGTIYNRLGVLYGPACEANLGEMHADLAILGGAGLTEEGLWNNNALIVSYQKRMMRAADRVLFVLDHSKFGRRALLLTTPFAPQLTILSTAEPEIRIARAIRAGGASYEVVRPEATPAEL